MADLHVISSKKDSSKDALDLLERVTELAKSGEITDLFIIGMGPDGGTYTNWTTSDLLKLMSMAARGTHRLNMRIDELDNL